MTTTTIQSFLRQTAEVKHVRVLYAAESGSRAWGFPSPDSDFDVRFIYMHPVDWYLSVQQRKDTIEVTDGALLDGSGWDLRKAIKLAFSSNVYLFEWLLSPVVYHKVGNFRDYFYDHLLPYFSPRVGVNHYLGLAEGILRREFVGESIKIKRYFYVLRPILAARWIYRERIPPPVRFRLLLDQLEEPMLRDMVDQLLEQKRRSTEGGEVERVPELEQFLIGEADELRRQAGSLPRGNEDPRPLDELFREVLRRY